jgi:hypothetical protein
MDFKPIGISPDSNALPNSPDVDLELVASPFTNHVIPSSSAPLSALGETCGSEVRSISKIVLDASAMSLIFKIVSLMLGGSCIVCNIGTSED